MLGFTDAPTAKILRPIGAPSGTRYREITLSASMVHWANRSIDPFSIPLINILDSIPRASRQLPHTAISARFPTNPLSIRSML